MSGGTRQGVVRPFRDAKIVALLPLRQWTLCRSTSPTLHPGDPATTENFIPGKDASLDSPVSSMKSRSEMLGSHIDERSWLNLEGCEMHRRLLEAYAKLA